MEFHIPLDDRARGDWVLWRYPQQVQERRELAALGWLCIFGAALLGMMIPSILLMVLPSSWVLFGIVTGMRVIALLLVGWGCSLYARSKGHSGWWGLTGLIGIGILIVLALPERDVPAEEPSHS